MTQPDPKPQARPCILAKPETIIDRAARSGYEGDTAIARAFGVGRSTAWRVLHHGGLPPVEFIAGALASLDAEFEDLFEVAIPQEV